MPGTIRVDEFINETKDDYNSPITSNFVSRMQQCRNTITTLEETLDYDRDGLTKMKKAIKAIHTSGNSHVDNEAYLAKALEKIGHNAQTKEQEETIGNAFSKFAVVTSELSALMKTLMQNLNNIVMFPLDNLLKGDLRGVKGDLKRPFDKAWKDYESKYSKIEKEKKQQAKDVGMIRNEIIPGEIADEMEKERRLFQLQMCEYLIKYNEIKTKKGIDLLQNLVEYYHAQTNYFQDGLKTIQHFGNYVVDLSVKLHKIRQTQDEEKRRLSDLRNLIKMTPSIEKEQIAECISFKVGAAAAASDKGGGGYSLHQLQGDKNHGVTKTGHLLKKSEGKMRRVWQKRKCRVQADGYLDICHADETKPPTRVNLLTCQIKMVPDDKRGFDLISYNRTYHFQAEDEADQRAWMSVLINCKDMALMRAFDDSSKTGGDKVNHSFVELQQAIIKYIQKIPGNDRCCDCNSQNDATWLSTNFGIIVCIECSGIHRDLGVHISRIQSLTLDNVGTSQLLLARYMTNNNFNEVMEAQMTTGKLGPASTMDERLNFIRAKYVEKRFVLRTCKSEMDKLCDLEAAVNRGELSALLQVFAENVDLGETLPRSMCGETALHRAIVNEISSRSHLHEANATLHIVDFLVQNMSSAAIDRQTCPPTGGSQMMDLSGCNTALHICASYDAVECMKLLLRSGADANIRNAANKTPKEIAEERGHATCVELLQNAHNRLKNLFENITIEWNLSHDDGSTDFSDDDTIIEDRNGSLTPEKKNRSRPPSYTAFAANVHGSLKKRAAPLPPPTTGSLYGTLPNSHHSRTPSDPAAGATVGLAGPAASSSATSSGYHTLNYAAHAHTHKRSPSSDSSSGRSVIQTGTKLVMSESKNSDKLLMLGGGVVRRPLNPPPPAPPTGGGASSRLSNGRSNESISSMTSDIDMPSSSSSSSMIHNPVPPPRRASDSPPNRMSSSPTISMCSPRSMQQQLLGGGGPMHMMMPPPGRLSSYNGPGMGGGGGGGAPLPAGAPIRRCKALYDCNADNDDELSFREGEIIIVTNEHTEDDNWMEGVVENQPHRMGMFPISFVHMLSDMN